MIKYNTLYHKDNKGKIRVWWMEREGNKYRTVAGIEDGNLVTSEWKVVYGKNIGKINETNDEQQADAEVIALYQKKIDRKYFESKDDITEDGKKIIEPMLAETYEGWDDKWKYAYSQPKLDGMRCIATKDGLFTRKGKLILSCPHIEMALFSYFVLNPNMILDGELYNHDLRDDFNELMSVLRKTKPKLEDIEKSREIAQYHIYDCITEEKLNFYDRMSVISDLTTSIKNPCIVQVPTCVNTSKGELDERYDQYLELGYEGQMIRHDTPYEHKRTKNLLKRKEFITEEFEVLRVLEGQGNWAGYAKSIEGVTEDGVIFNAGIRGNRDFNKKLLSRKIKLATVRYQQKTPDGNLRFPVAIDFFENIRED